ncbi:MAG: hypothetical protein HGA49_01315 [Eubacteriaceae bacterium]|nr:hypothetical protein [Eubacteriaceae bacterium]
MKIFDRKFLQYQLAALKHNKYKNSVLIPNVLVILAAVFLRENIFAVTLLLVIAAGVIAYGHLRFKKEANSDENSFDLALEKKFSETQKQMNKKGNTGLTLQYYALGVELEKIDLDEAIAKITEAVKADPESKRYGYNFLLTMHILKSGKDYKKIPIEYIEYLDKVMKNEKNINVLTEATKNALLLGENAKALNLANKADEELKSVKKIKKPVFNAVYRTNIIMVPFYRGLAYKNMGSRKKAEDSFEEALKNCKSEKLRMIILNEKN